MTGVPNPAAMLRIRNRSQPRHAAAPRAAAAKMGRTCDAVELREIRHCQHIADIRMTPINNQIGTSACTNQLLEFNGVDDEESVGEDTTGLPPEDDDPEDIDFLCRTEEDILQGYLPDSPYNPVNMEDDGVYPQELNWSYSDIVPYHPIQHTPIAMEPVLV
jgi:hypothetical protein